MSQPSADSPFAAFHYRDFRLFWFSQFVSNIGTWMQITAMSWLLLELTNSPLDASGLHAARFPAGLSGRGRPNPGLARLRLYSHRSGCGLPRCPGAPGIFPITGASLG